MTAKNSKQPSHLKDLILLFAIPIGIAVIAAVIIYIPRFLANPQYDFIYSVCEDYNCGNDYRVDASGYVSEYKKDTPYQEYDNSNRATLRYYDAGNDSTRSLTLEESRGYSLNTSSKSPDGYTLSSKESGGGFLFSGDYSANWRLKNGAKNKNVELSNSDYYYSSDIKFLGWVNK